MMFKALVVSIFGIAIFAPFSASAASPCDALRKACQVAGYQIPAKGSPVTTVQSLRQSGKDLTRNCFEPALKGKAASVKGLKVDPSWSLAQCQAEITATRAQYKKRKQL